MHFKGTVGPIGLMEGLDSLVFNHHFLNPLVLTDSLIFAKSLVTGTAHLSKGCAGRALRKIKCFILQEHLVWRCGGTGWRRNVLIVSVGVWVK